MVEDFLGKFVGGQNRAQLLRIFVFNQRESFTLAQASKRSGLSEKATKEEIKSLEQLDIIKEGKFTITLGNGTGRSVQGKQKEHTWIFNTQCKYAAAISKFVYEVSPMRYDNVVAALRRSGRPTAVILSGNFVGDPTRPADLIVALDVFNERRLEQAVKGLEPVYGLEIRYAAFSTPEFRYRLTVEDRLMRDTLDFPHLVLLDKTRLL